jgi:hypothetical protein
VQSRDVFFGLPRQIDDKEALGSGGRCSIHSTDVQERVFQVDLLPAKGNPFRRTQAVPKGNKHHRGVPVLPTVVFGGFSQPFDLLLVARADFMAIAWRTSRSPTVPLSSA